MGSIVSVEALIGLCLLLAALIDLRLVPGHIFGTLYAIPIMLAALSTRRRMVWATIILAVPLYLLGAANSATTVEIWVFRVLGFAGVCGLAVVMEARRREAERHAREQQAIAAAAQALAREHHLDQAASVIAEQAQGIIESEIIELWEADHQRHEWHLVAQRGLTTQTVDTVRVITFDDANLLSCAIRAGDLLEIPDPSVLTPEYRIAREVAEREGIRSAQVQPLIDNGRAIGAVMYLHRGHRRLSAHQRAMAQSIGSLWSVALINARLYTEAADRAREAEEARGNLQRFVGMVAHDLRGPVTSARGYAQLLHGRSVKDAARLDHGLSMIEQSTSQMMRLINDLLDAAQIGAGRFEVQRSRIDLAVLTRDVIDALQATTTEHDLSLTGPPTLVGRWDGDRLRQLLTNLLTNAIKYSPQGGAVWVRLHLTDDGAMVSVSDQGRGIPMEEAEHLFDPFIRLEPKGEVRGAGLGLYIAKGIVEAHGGRIWIDPGPARGTTFWFILPLGDEPAPGASTRPSENATNWPDGADPVGSRPEQPVATTRRT